MSKVTNNFHNDFCPQTLFLYGTKKEDGSADFGLFCWFSYINVDGKDGSHLGVMACIGEEKMTKDNIRRTGVFSANLVNEKLLPLADYYGCTSGRAVKDKMKLSPTIEHGNVLDVPLIAESPVNYELRVLKEIHLAEGSDLFVCEICNVLVEENLMDKNVPFPERLKLANPVIACGELSYCTTDGRFLGKWGDLRKELKDVK
jgi:flavin reductase (DIM6/NTAB) family NADH-FMN oxidoreductase RutF